MYKLSGPARETVSRPLCRTIDRQCAVSLDPVGYKNTRCAVQCHTCYTCLNLRLALTSCVCCCQIASWLCCWWLD